MNKTGDRKHKLQALEVGARIDWLKQHIERFESDPNSGAGGRALVKAWNAELVRKRQLKLRLQSGEGVSDFECQNNTDAAGIIRRALGAGASRRETRG